MLASNDALAGGFDPYGPNARDYFNRPPVYSHRCLGCGKFVLEHVDNFGSVCRWWWRFSLRWPHDCAPANPARCCGIGWSCVRPPSCSRSNAPTTISWGLSCSLRSCPARFTPMVGCGSAGRLFFTTTNVGDCWVFALWLEPLVWRFPRDARVHEAVRRLAALTGARLVWVLWVDGITSAWLARFFRHGARWHPHEVGRYFLCSSRRCSGDSSRACAGG